MSAEAFAPTPETRREWVLDTDNDIAVSVQIADQCYAAPGNLVTIRDEENGCVCVYRSSVDELIAALRAAAEEISS